MGDFFVPGLRWIFIFWALLCISPFFKELGAQHSIQWHNGMDFSTPDKDLGYRRDELVFGHYYRLIDFGHLLTPDDKRNLQGQGIWVLEYISGCAYICAVSSTRSIARAVTDKIRAIYRISALHKMTNGILMAEACNGNAEASDVVMQYHANLDAGQVRQLLRQAPFAYSRVEYYNRMIYATVPVRMYAAICELPWISYLSCVNPPGEPEDREGRNLHRVNAIGYNGAEQLFLDGKGVKVMVRDDGLVGPHIDFKGRLTQEAYGTAGTHGDMTAGILCGANNLDPNIEGMAPGAELYIINYQADFLDRTLHFHQKEGVVVTNTSYSDGCNTGYTLSAQVVDKQIFENPSLLHVFSAGNSNGLDCGYGAGNQWGNITGGHKIGKNAITCANLRLDASLETSSSRGPAKDGRLKPEISARGTGELSTAPNNSIQVGGGTSAASPGVAGVCALLYEAYKARNKGQNPESALIKAAVMNTATDIGTSGPDYQFGFGVVNAYNAFKLLDERRYQRRIIGHQQVQEFEVRIDSGSPLLKLMIYWAEEPAAIQARKALINDIDFEVTAPNGTLYKPWMLNPTPDAAALAVGATKGIDTLNNFEQISIPYPLPGTYKIKVIGKFLPSFEVPYYFLHELEPTELALTFPLGGEKLDITEFTQVHYIAYGQDSISVRFSPDGGRNWQLLGKREPGTRLINWTLPAQYTSDSCLIELQQGPNTVRSNYFTISPLVSSFSFARYCPDSFELKWTRIAQDSFLIYKLGDKYMEPFALSKKTSIVLPTEDMRKEEWFSIAGYTHSVLSKRRLALSTPDTAINCSLKTDLALDIPAMRNKLELVSCESLHLKPRIDVINRTAHWVKGFAIGSFKDGQVTEQSYSESIAPYDTITVDYSAGLELEDSGRQQIPIWLRKPGDENRFNDTFFVHVDYTAIPSSEAQFPMTETFNSATGLPPYWTLFNSIPVSTFSLVTVRNRGGQMSQVLGFKNDNNVFAGERMKLFSRPADLSSAREPYLYFKLAVQGRTNNFLDDTIAVRIRSICHDAPEEMLLLSFGAGELMVDTSNAQNWNPRADSNWYSFAYDLKAWKGKQVVMEIEIDRGFNNWIYFDDISFREKDAETRRSDFTISANPICFNRTVIIADSSEIEQANIKWDFGPGATPSRIAYGPGPVSVRYLNAGIRKIVQTVRGKDQDAINVKTITLVPAATPAFTFKILSGRTVAFENRTTNSNIFTWDFNDGNKSNERDPVHTFDSSKLYRVKLTASNLCGNPSKTEIVDLTNVVSNHDISEDSRIRVYPNPSKGLINIVSEASIYRCAILTSDFKLLQSIEMEGRSVCEADLSGYPPGLYLIKIYAGKEIWYRKITKI